MSQEKPQKLAKAEKSIEGLSLLEKMERQFEKEFGEWSRLSKSEKVTAVGAISENIESGSSQGDFDNENRPWAYAKS